MVKRRAIPLIAFALVAGCTTSPTGRQQLMLTSQASLESASQAAFRELKREQPLSDNRALTAYVNCVADAITARLPERRPWEVAVFADDAVNAFAMPGGKIGVFEGLLKAARTPDQLAVVIGHEVGHVLANHSAERQSQNLVAGLGVVAGGVLGTQAGMDPSVAQSLTGTLASLGFLLPFSRVQESEADVIGLELMARAGFDPRAAPVLWRNMEEVQGSRFPEFLSTHPSAGNRAARLQSLQNDTLPLYQAARRAGIRPACRAPR
ncbi:MAG: M48 family metallopeptidase [Candidatus Competibacterales bacterium]